MGIKRNHPCPAQLLAPLGSPPSAPSLHPGVAFSGSARILGEAVLMRVTAPCGPSKKHLSLHPQSRLVRRGICRPTLCVPVRGRRCWEHALKASNLFIFTLLRGDHRSPVTGQRAGGSSAGSAEINPWGTACLGQVASP